MIQGGISRRLLLAQLAAAWAALGEGDDPFRTLRGEHPRLILLDSELDRLRLSIREAAPIRRIYSELQREADRMLTAAPIDYKPGTPLGPQSRRALDRVYTLALLYRLDRKQAYLDRAVQELRAAAGFRDWNPGHFSDCAELAHAFAIGYDWLYPALNDADRALFRDAIVQKALLPALVYYRGQSAWTVNRSTANAACNGGLALAALAVATAIETAEPGANGENPGDLPRSILRYALDSIPRSLATYGADGSWPEGPAYWAAATSYFVYFAAALQTALGLDFGVSSNAGLAHAGRYRIYFSGPSNKSFNFGESTDELTVEPAMFWLARRYAQPVFAWQEQKFAERATDAEPLDLVWYQREAKPPQGPLWPLDGIFVNPASASFRSSWEDPGALFLAVKGGDNKTPRAHLDLGSFVLDAGGVRWAIDLGPDDGAALPVAPRTKGLGYRARTEAHNTLLIDGENQDPRAEAKIVHHDFTPDLAWVQIDLSKAYSARIRQCQRRIGIAQRQAVLMQDTLQADQPSDVQWCMVTDAEIVLNGQGAELTKGSSALAAEILSPRHAVFDTVAIPGSSGLRKLVVRLGEKVTGLDLNISLTPHRLGSPKPKTTVRFPV